MDGQNENNYQSNTVNGSSQQAPKQTNALAIVALVMGILSIVINCCLTGVGIIPGIAGIVCAILSKKQGKSGMATAGLICSIIGIVLGVILLILMAIGFAALDQMGYYY